MQYNSFRYLERASFSPLFKPKYASIYSKDNFNSKCSTEVTFILLRMARFSPWRHQCCAQLSFQEGCSDRSADGHVKVTCCCPAGRGQLPPVSQMAARSARGAAVWIASTSGSKLHLPTSGIIYQVSFKKQPNNTRAFGRVILSGKRVTSELA